MRRPEENNPRTIEPAGVALAAVSCTLLPGFGPAIDLWLCAGFGLTFISLACFPSMRKVGGYYGLTAPAILFLAAMASLALGTTTFSIGGGHPLWQTVHSPFGGAAVDMQAEWIGLIELLGVAFAFLTATRLGRRRQTARTTSDALIVLGGMFGLIALGDELSRVLQIYRRALLPSLTGSGPGAAFFGLVSVLAAERFIGSWRTRSESARESVFKRIRSFYAPLLAMTVCWGALAVHNQPALVLALTMSGLLVAWTALSGGEQNRVPRRVLIWLAPAAIGLAVLISFLFVNSLSSEPNAVLSRSAHAAAFWASPWHGYGLGAQGTVAALFMNRLNIEALSAYPMPMNAYLSWMEQGGILAATPLMVCVIWIIGLVLFSALKTRHLKGLMRGVVCSSLFLIAFSLISAGPATVSIEAIWAILLGLGSGACALSR